MSADIELHSQQSEEHTCLNCGNTYSGRICSNCGQRAGIKRLTVKQVLGDIPRSFLYLEKRFSRLLRDFYKDPIQTIKDYSERKRRHYSSPVQAYYFFTSIYLILRSMYVSDLEGFSEGEDMMDAVFDRFVEAMNLMEELSETVYVYLTLPISLGISFAWFFRKSLNLAESIAMAYLFYTHIAILWILESILHICDVDTEAYFWYSYFLEITLCGLLFLLAFKRRRYLQFLRGSIAFLLSLLIIGIALFIYAVIYVYLIA